MHGELWELIFVDIWGIVKADIFAAVVAISTTVYAILTWKLVSETKRLREVQTEPNLAVYLVPRPEWGAMLDLRIENVGAGIATDVRLHATPNIEAAGDKKINDLGLFTDGLPMLAPGRSRQFYLTNLHGSKDFETLIKSEFVVKADYSNSDGNRVSDHFTIGFSEFRDLMIEDQDSGRKIAAALEKIQRDISHWDTGFRKLGVNVYTARDRDRKEELIRARREDEIATHPANNTKPPPS